MPETSRHRRARVLLDVDHERDRQDRMHGSQRQLRPEQWLSVLAREFCEAGNLANEAFKGRASASAPGLRAELVQLAAVAVAWVEAIDAAAQPLTPTKTRLCPKCRAYCLGFDCPERDL